MATNFRIEKNGPATPSEIEALRLAVGWDKGEGNYDERLKRAYAYFTVRVESHLIGFLSVISDGVSDALLVDLMVHPRYQRKHIGQDLVQRAVEDIRSAGIRCVQVTFAPRLDPFFRNCGFRISGGGFIDFKARSVK